MPYKPTQHMLVVLYALHTGGYITLHHQKFWWVDAQGRQTWLRDNTYFGLSENGLIQIGWVRDPADDKLYRHDTLTELGRSFCV